MLEPRTFMTESFATDTLNSAHAYEGQMRWESTIHRLKDGGGILLDLAFLGDDHGRRVAALAVDIWAHQQVHGAAAFPAVRMVRDETELLAGLRERLPAATRSKP